VTVERPQRLASADHRRYAVEPGQQWFERRVNLQDDAGTEAR
jgi:hypothetical protein